MGYSKRHGVVFPSTTQENRHELHRTWEHVLQGVGPTELWLTPLSCIPEPYDFKVGDLAQLRAGIYRACAQAHYQFSIMSTLPRALSIAPTSAAQASALSTARRMCTRFGTSRRSQSACESPHSVDAVKRRLRHGFAATDEQEDRWGDQAPSQYV